MAKKKKGGKKKKAGDGDEPEPLEEFRKLYKKVYTVQNGVSQSKTMKSLVDQAEEDGEDLENLFLYEEEMPEGIRAIFETLIATKFPTLKQIRIWKAQAKNEGARIVCKFLEQNSSVKICDMMGNQITNLGCEFFGRMLNPELNSSLTVLKLDHNPIGSQGLAQLARGLCSNSSITELGLDYCSIDYNGGKSLQEILGFVESGIKLLSLQGNQLEEKGVFDLFRALDVNTTLTHLVISDNQFGESDPDLIKQMCKVFENENACGYFDMQYNGISNDAMREFLNVWRLNKNCWKVKVTMKYIDDPDVVKQFNEVMKKRKQPKKKKGKKGKKKKKKKKK